MGCFQWPITTQSMYLDEDSRCCHDFGRTTVQSVGGCEVISTRLRIHNCKIITYISNTTYCRILGRNSCQKATTSNTSRPSIIEPSSPKVSGEKVQQEPTAQTSDLLIGGLAELMLKEPLTTKPITK